MAGRQERWREALARAAAAAEAADGEGDDTDVEELMVRCVVDHALCLCRRFPLFLWGKPIFLVSLQACLWAQQLVTASSWTACLGTMKQNGLTLK